MSHDGGDHFKDQGALDAWMQTLHKSANGVFTMCQIFYYADDDLRQYLWSTNGSFSSTDRVGVSLIVNEDTDVDGRCRIQVGNSGGEADTLSVKTLGGAADNAGLFGSQPTMFAAVIDNQSGTGFFYKNGAYCLDSNGDETFSVSFAANTTTNNNKLAWGASGRTSGPFAWVGNGTKLYSAFLDDTAWTKAELDQIWARVSGWLLASS